MRTNGKTFAHALILIPVMAALAGCGTKKTVAERVEREVDSTAITALRTELSAKDKVIESLTSDLERTREEDTRLAGEYSSHTINYDTNAPVNPETGEYPKASETRTESRHTLEKTLKEMETLKREHKREAETLQTLNSNLELTVEALRRENRELKTKSVPGFNIKSFLWGMAIGAVMLLLLAVFLKNKL